MLESQVIQEILGVPGWSRVICVIWVRAVTCVVSVTPVGTGGRSKDVFEVTVVVSDTPVGDSRDVSGRSVCALSVTLPAEVPGVSGNGIELGGVVDVCGGTTTVVTLLDIACRE